MVQHEVAGLDENQKSYDSADNESTDLEVDYIAHS
jgi:hypothetical protein